MARQGAKRDKDLPDSKQIFRYWVDILELKSGSIRNLPLKQVTKIHLPRTKKELQRPREEVLQLQDDSDTLEGKSLDDLAAQLRQHYPDAEYERRLHWERDRQAEQRYARAMNGLIEILANAIVNERNQEESS